MSGIDFAMVRVSRTEAKVYRSMYLTLTMSERLCT